MTELKCENLKKSFGDLVALDDVTLTFRGGIISIIGPNGVGKTTLLNILTGFLQPDEGSVYINQKEITPLPPHKITELGISRTFQDVRIIRRLSTTDNILLSLPNQPGERLWGAIFNYRSYEEKNRSVEKAQSLLDFVGLIKKKDTPAGNLSYGEQKLLAIACCLATEAEILLLDEPVTGVDPGMIQHVLNRLRAIREDGRLVVFIEHDLDSVREVASEVLVMDDGRIIGKGPPSEILDRKDVLKSYIS
jgi:ABC-type branched-subunit amino acid transport system ATPase component